MKMYPKNYFKDLRMASVVLPITAIVGFIVLFIAGAMPSNINDHPDIIIGIISLFILLAVGVFYMTKGKKKADAFSQKSSGKNVSLALALQLIFAVVLTAVIYFVFHDILYLILIGVPSGFIFARIIKAFGIH